MKIICCEHNRCPDRPRRRLSRFTDRPWRCPQCGSWWVTEGIRAIDGSVCWFWKLVHGPKVFNGPIDKSAHKTEEDA